MKRGPLDCARRAHATLNKVLAKRPNKDDHALAEVTQDLCVWRDSLIDGFGGGDAERDRLQRLNGVLSVVVGMHYPLGEFPWAPLQAAVHELERLIETMRA